MAKRTRHDTPNAELGTGEPQDGNSELSGKDELDSAVDSNSGDGTVIEPASIASDGSGGDQSGRKRRSDAGRKRGPRGTAKTSDKIDLGEFGEILSEAHSFLAFICSVPEIALDETKDEHTKMARAFERVARHYDIPALNPVTRDWIMLFKTLGMIYGAHFMQYNERQRSERARNVTPRPAGIQAPQSPKSAQSSTPKPNGAATPPPQPGATVSQVMVPGFEHLGPVTVKH